MVNTKDLKFYVRPVELDDIDVYSICSNRNDNDRFFLKDVNLYSETKTREWLKNLPSTSKRFMVCVANPNEKHPINIFFPDNIGVIRIDLIDYVNSNCQIGLDIFEKFKGKGLAIPIYRWLLNHLFYELNFNSVYLEVTETNTRAIHIYEKLGFKIDGRLRNRIFREGTYWDTLYMSLLRREYKNE